MSDKEPRRRKKRKDVQPQRKDDIRSDDHVFMSTKSETKDSDQEAEEEVVVPSHQPSVFAKFVFVLLFSGLVVSMSFIFISLHGTDRGEVELFDDHHAEEIEISHDEHHGEDTEIPHDDHNGEDIEIPHDDHHGEDNEFSHDDHDEEEESSGPSLQESIADYFPGISSLFFKDEHSVESERESTNEDLESTDSLEEQISELPVPSSTADYVDATDQDHTDEDAEESISPEVYPETAQEILKPTFSKQESQFSTSPPEPILEEEDVEQTSENIAEDSYFASYSPEPESATENYLPTEDSLFSNVPVDEEQLQPVDQDVDDADEFPQTVTESAEGEQFSNYEKESITNEADYKIRHQLDELDDILERSPERCLRKCEELLQLHSESPRLHYVKAQAMDHLAEVQRSNKQLEDAIAEYQRVMALNNVPDELYMLAGKRAADRMRFRGFMGKSVKLLSQMAEKFPENVEVKNLLAVGYLLIGQNKESKRVLSEVLKVAPDSGFAKVHLGFIMKTDDSKYEEAAQLLSEGIASREQGVIDGRFYFHLGDALHRIGRQDEAMKVYKEAVEEGLFLSVYQRSLYNVKGLTGKPWWNPLTTVYAPYFKILEKNWKTIRDEALSLTNERNSGFMPETEGLQDKGDWKQFELFARGRKIEKNCLKAPRTCSLISQFPDAVNCKRGQVKFSIMQPSTHVWAHTGPTNCRLRSHLGLVIPEGTSIRVANETRTWEEGKVILFDDSFEHEVWHNGNVSRLVLIVDFWHPELTAYQKRSLTPI